MTRNLVSALLALFLAACQAPGPVYDVPLPAVATASPGEQPDATDEGPDPTAAQATAETGRGVQRLSALQRTTAGSAERDWSQLFPDDDEIRLAVEDMPLSQFLHYVFGELLQVNYVIADGLQDTGAARTPRQIPRQMPTDPRIPRPGGSQQAATSGPPDLEAPVTVNLQQAVSSRRLYAVAIEYLAERNVGVTYNDGVFYLHALGRGAGGASVGFGSRPQDVPEMPGPILQIIPLRYGLTPSIERTIGGLVNADVIGDPQQGALFVTGERFEILRVLDVVRLMDQPAQRGRYVGLVTLTYVTTEEFMDRIVELLSAEGVPTGIGPGADSGSVALVSLESIGAVAVFAASRQLLDRVDFWARQLDRPAEGAERRYYVYTPRFARADELGQSLAPLLGETDSPAESDARDTRSALGNQTADSVMSNALSNRRGDDDRRGARAPTPQVVVRSPELTMSVDLRANALIFFTTGTRYQALLPMIRRLDTPPRQILLDATIAEVLLTDEFALGVEFALERSEVSLGTTGGLGLPEGGGFISIVGNDGAVRAQLSASNRLVNILSNPSLVVRDGVSATISVGNDIPTIGATFFDPIQSDTQVTSVQYRKTGVNLTVRPTLNAQGLVVMEIDQEISNTVEGGSEVQGTPAIFERRLSTEVVARSGETVLLGGLISENNNENTAKVPVLGDIPLLGRLFRSDSKTTERTELVVMITPQVLDESARWDEILSRLNRALRHLALETGSGDASGVGKKTTP